MTSKPNEKGLTPKQVLEDGLRPLLGTRLFRVTTLVLALLFAAGVAGLVLRLQGGFEDRAAWGYYAALFSFLLATAGSAPVAAVLLRLTSTDWRRPITRAVEIFAVVGLLLLLMSIPLLALQPRAAGRPTIWLGWPLAPHLYDTLALAAFVACGLLLFYASAMPDFAAKRDFAVSGESRWPARLAWRWQGTVRHWRIQRAVLALLGAFYLMLLILVHSLIAADFAESLVPGWKDPLFPVQQALVGFQTGLATTVVVMALLRRLGFQGHIELEHFWAMGKILLAFSLLWAYFWFSGFIVMWYGRLPVERELLDLFWFGPYLPLFLATLLLNFAGPLAILMWNPLRRSIRWPVVVSLMIITGTLLEKVRFYVAAYSVAGSATLEQVPAARLPDFPDVLIFVGGISGAALMYILASRIVPVIAIWEIKEGLLLRARGALVKLGVWVVAKPE